MKHHQHGFSLVETILTIVIITIALLAMVFGFSQTAGNSSDPLWQSKTAHLGQAYTEEILTKRYDEQTPIGGVPACSSGGNACTAEGSFGFETGETRATFDDVDDYHQLSESPSLNALGVQRPDYNGYQVQVTISYAGSAFGRDNDLVKRIEIQVTPPGGENTVSFVSFRGNY